MSFDRENSFGVALVSAHGGAVPADAARRRYLILSSLLAGAVVLGAVIAILTSKGA